MAGECLYLACCLALHPAPHSLGQPSRRMERRAACCLSVLVEASGSIAPAACRCRWLPDSASLVPVVAVCLSAHTSGACCIQMQVAAAMHHPCCLALHPVHSHSSQHLLHVEIQEASGMHQSVGSGAWLRTLPTTHRSQRLRRCLPVAAGVHWCTHNPGHLLQAASGCVIEPGMVPNTAHCPIALSLKFLLPVSQVAFGVHCCAGPGARRGLQRLLPDGVPLCQQKHHFPWPGLRRQRPPGAVH